MTNKTQKVITSKCMSLNNSPPILSRDGSLNEGRRQAKKSTHSLFCALAFATLGFAVVLHTDFDEVRMF
jgi:hypothetical protein